MIQIQADATDQAGEFIALGRVADEARRLVDHQQVGVFMEDVKKFIQARLILTTDGHG